MNCPACGHINRDNAKFCEECGATLIRSDASDPEAPPPLPQSFVDGRYRVDALLGEGSRKIVYRAHDTRLSRDVAFALIKTDGLDADGRIRVQQEAQAMARLGSHPHIVTIHDIGEEAGQTYIVSEFVAGGDLAQALDEAPDHRLSIDRAVALSAEICQALEHAHAEGIVHREVKPGNIWLDANGAAQLGDFGLAVAVDESRLTREGTLIGTVAYMAPEQAMGTTVDARADLYALGCVLYELLTGRPPFVGDDAVAVISQHLNTEPVVPSWHNQACPAALEVLLLRLLAKDPVKRPASAAEVSDALASAITVPAEIAPSGDSAPSADPIYRRTFVGREQELGQLKAAFDAALSGQGGLVMVVGEPGIGKTTLTEQLGTYVGLRGGTTLTGHCYEEGSLSLPYLPFVEAIRTYVLECDADTLRIEMGSTAGDLARIVPEVGDRLHVPPVEAADSEADQYRLFEAVTTLLRNVAGDRPLCLILEDLHDADRGTLALLQYVARSLEGTRLLVIGTYRDVEVDRTHALSATVAELRRGAAFERIRLRGLSPDEVARMLTNISGRTVPWGLVEGVHQQTEGNPLFIQEVVRYIVEEGLLESGGGASSETGTEALLAHIPEGLRDVIGRRLSRLTAEAEQALTVAAVIGREFSLAVLEAVAGMPDETLLSALEEAVAVAVLDDRSDATGVRFRFTHAFFRQTLYDELIAPRRLRLHQEIARAVESVFADRRDEHAAELAEHFAYSTDSEDLAKAIRYGEQAAQRSIDVYAYSEAARLWDRALAVQTVLDPDDAERIIDLSLDLSEALLAAGEERRIFDDLAQTAFRLAEQLEDVDRAMRACLTALEACWAAGGSDSFRTGSGREWAVRVDQRARPGTPGRLWADLYLGVSRWMEGRPEDGLRLYDSALEAARDLGDAEAFQVAATRVLSGLQGPRREVWCRDLARELWAAPREGVSTDTLTHAFNHVAQIALCWGDLREANEAWAEIATMAERTKHAGAVGTAAAMEATQDLMSGRLEEGLAAVEAAHAGEASRAVIHFSALPMLILLGRPAEAYERYAPIYWPMVIPALLATGRTAEARDALHKLVEVQDARLTDNEWQFGGWMLGLVLEHAIALDERALVERVAVLIAPSKAVTGGHFHLAYIDRSRGMAAAYLGDAEGARAYYEAAIQAAETLLVRPELALTRFQLAELLLDQFSSEAMEAREHLDFAITEFHEMQMAPALESAIRLKLAYHGIADTDVRTSIVAVAQSVEHEHLDLAPQAAPDGTVTILFTDIAGSTVLNERLGDARWVELLREHNGLIRAQVAAHRGFEVKNQGDGFMLAFGSAVDGLRCAIGIQETLVDQGGDGPVVAVRIGLHTGEAIKEDDDFFGRHVALAARIGNAAQAGQILASGLVQALTDSSGEFRFDRGQDVPLKGIDGPQRVHRVLWRPEDTVAPFPDGLSAREVEVLQQLAQGKSNAEIADVLVIASATVARHVSNILNKTALANRTEAATYAATHGLLE